MRIDEFEFQDRNGNEIEPTKNQLVVYIKSLHKEIAELKKQLKEKKKKIEDLKKSKQYFIINYNHIIDKLQKQLESQPAEIVEKIKEQIFNHFNVKNIEEYERLSLLNALFTADAVAEILDTILKEYQK